MRLPNILVLTCHGEVLPRARRLGFLHCRKSDWRPPPSNSTHRMACSTVHTHDKSAAGHFTHSLQRPDARAPFSRLLTLPPAVRCCRASRVFSCLFSRVSSSLLSCLLVSLLVSLPLVSRRRVGEAKARHARTYGQARPRARAVGRGPVQSTIRAPALCGAHS